MLNKIYMGAKILGARIQIEPVPKPQGAIITGQEEEEYVRVVKVGPDVSPEINPGDLIVIIRDNVQHLELDRASLYLIFEEDVLAHVTLDEEGKK